MKLLYVSILVLFFATNANAEFKLYNKKSTYSNKESNPFTVNGEIYARGVSDFMNIKRSKTEDVNHIREEEELIYGDLEYLFRLKLNKYLFVDSRIVAEPVFNRQEMMLKTEDYKRAEYDYTRNKILREDRDTYIKNYGLIMEELNVKYRTNDLMLMAGKYNLPFGMAWNKMAKRGAFTHLWPEDYKMSEKIGGALIARLETARLGLYSFFDDNTFLSNSATQERGNMDEQHKGDGSNKKSFSSHLISISGRDFMRVPNLTYNFSYLKKAKSYNKTAEEKGFSGTFEFKVNLGMNSNISSLVEIVQLKNFAGINLYNATYSTLSTTLKLRGFEANISNTSKEIDSIDVVESNVTKAKYDAYVNHVSLGYLFDNNFKIEFANMDVNEYLEDYRSIGVVVSYTNKF